MESLGNHELDETEDGLVPFVRNLSAPVVAANLILDKVPELKELTNLHASVILAKNGVQIGIIGYLTPDTKFLTPHNEVEYEDEILAIRREVQKLKNNGVAIIIALGHSGFVKDVEIAKKVEDLDLVIGGHSNTFLWNGDSTEKPEKREGPYPVVVQQSNGKRVLVVQAYAYTKYMGRLHLTFNSRGDIIEYDGIPLLLDNSIQEDPAVLSIVETYRVEINKINIEVVGSSSVFLNGNCRLRECNMGNIITDMVLNYTKRNNYSDITIAIIQSGRIRVSIDRSEKPFKITKGDWMTVLPFTDSLTKIVMNGTVLKRALEHSVAAWRPVDRSGQFLQFSGLKVVYDLLKPPGARIVRAHAACPGCTDGQLAEITDSDTYNVMMNLFLAEGGDGFSMFAELPHELVPFNELTCIYNYLKAHPVINPKTSDRITLLNEEEAIRTYRQYSEKETKPSSSPSVVSSNNCNIVFLLCAYTSIMNLS